MKCDTRTDQKECYLYHQVVYQAEDSESESDPEQDDSHDLGAQSEGPVLSIIPDIGAEPFMRDQPAVESVRTADETGRGQKQKGSSRQQRKDDTQGGKYDSEDSTDAEQPFPQI